MFTIQHLQQRRSELQNQYDLLSRQIQRLGESHAVETDPAIEFKLEKQMEQAEAKRGRIAEQIQNLDDQIEALDNSIRLRKALSKLNYHDQVHVFRQLLEKSQIGALVIHGKPGHGQDWLLNRLVNQVPYKTTGQVVSVNLQSFAHGWDIDAIRYQLRRYTGLTHLHSLQEIAAQVHRWWQTQTVVLIVHNLNVMDAKCIKEFFQVFWLPLVERALSDPSPSPLYQLLLFLVDNGDSVDTWPIVWAEQIDSAWEPYVPIKLPKLTQFSRDILNQWIEYEIETLPAKMRSVQVEDILRNTKDGIPQFTLEYICEVCDCNWFV